MQVSHNTTAPEAFPDNLDDALARRIIGLGSPTTPNDRPPAASSNTDPAPVSAGTSKSKRPSKASRPAAPRQGTKRGRYVSRACHGCQRRKVKCTAEEPCEPCVSAQLECVYPAGGKRRKTNKDRPAASVDGGSETSRESPPPLPASDFLQQTLERIAALERDRDSLREQRTTEGGPSASNQYASPQSLCSAPHLPEKPAVRGATSILQSIEAVERNVVHEGGTQFSRAQTPLPSGYDHIAWQDLPRGNNEDISTLERDTRAADANALNHSLDVFFQLLNPHYPCFNENQVRSLVGKFLANDETLTLSDADRLQTVAMINLIQAEVKILCDEWPDSSTAPAWMEFCRADSILDRLTWLGRGNLLTVQCLLLKARCLFYLEKPEATCETMAKVVRLCFHLGLHNQQSWTDISPFECVMRQRIMWTVFYLERHMTFNIGVPYLLRESDICVDLPKSYDDTLMFPDHSLPDELPEHALERSFSTYLSLALRWSKLSAEIWDSVFAVTAKKPTNEEFVASMDARVAFLTSQFPSFLQWETVAGSAFGDPFLPSYVPRQATILRLRNNQLRLLLRQDDILSMKYDAKTAEDYTTIAADSINVITVQAGDKSGRWSAVLYLMSTLLPLVSIIIRSENTQTTRAAAIEAYKKGQVILDKLAPGFSTARHSLRRCYTIITAAKRAIRKFAEGELSPLSQGGSALHMDFADPLMDFDFSAADALLEPEKDKFNEMLTGMMSDPTFGSFDDQPSAFWTGDDLFGSQWVG